MYRTYFKLHGAIVAYIYPALAIDVPGAVLRTLPARRLQRHAGLELTGDIGPRFSLLRAVPGSPRTTINKGGDKRMYNQLEYFLPLLPEAGIKALLFTDIGRVYNDDELVDLQGAEPRRRLRLPLDHADRAVPLRVGLSYRRWQAW